MGLESTSSFSTPGSVAVRRRNKLAFDGNHTDLISNWIITKADFVELSQDSVDTLLEATYDGNLSWVVFPPYGYRL